MKTLAKILTGIVALEHLYFLVLEMFLWTTPYGRGVFDLTVEFAQESAPLAMNQGLYNGFLAAGLAWALFSGKRDVRIFFLICVIIAGIFGGLTVSPKIFFVQSIPAILALLFTLMKR